MKNIKSLFAVFFIFIVSACATDLLAQKVGFISSNTIRAKFPEAIQADQRLQSVIEDWKRELSSFAKQIQDVEFEIKKNRLIWSDLERSNKTEELKSLKQRRSEYAKMKFGDGGEMEKTTKSIIFPIDQKIYAAVQQVAADEGYDIVLDQSIQPLPYVNFKYDLTVRVLKKLGLDVGKMEKELDAKIKKDPRNKKRKSRAPRRGRRTRKPSRDVEEKKIEDKKDPQMDKKLELQKSNVAPVSVDPTKVNKK